MMKTTRAKTVKTPALEKPRLLALSDNVKETEIKAQCWGPAWFGLLVTDKSSFSAQNKIV
jgi:hypothetical protein